MKNIEDKPRPSKWFQLLCERQSSLTIVLFRCRRGYIFDRQKHPSGTEVKAITYSAMQVNENTSQGDREVFVIVDI